MYQQYIYMYQQHQTCITVSTTTYNNNQNLKKNTKKNNSRTYMYYQHLWYTDVATKR